LSHISSFLKLYRSNAGFRGPILKLLSATGYASVAGYLGMLVLVRLYPADAFGLFDFVISVVGILTPVVSLRYEDSLMLVEEDRDGAHAYLLAIGTTLVISSSLWILYPFRHEIAAFFNNASIAEWIWILPLILVLVRFVKISELWLTRHKQFGRVSIGQVTQTTTMVSVRIGAGFYSPTAGGLIYGYIAGWALGFLVNLRLVSSSLRVALKEGFSAQRVRFLARRYRRFPIFTMPAAMISMFGSRLPFLLLLYYFDLETVGYFGRAFGVLFIPLSLVGAAVAQVFFVRAVEARREGSLQTMTDTIHRRLVFLAWYPTLALIIAGPELFQILFGEAWIQSGVMVQYAGPWILFSAIASPLSRLFDVLERQKLELATNVAIFVVIAVALVYGGSRDDLLLSLLLLGMGGALIRIWQIIVLLKLSSLSATAFLSPYIRYALHSLPWLLIVFAAVQWSTRLAVVLSAVIGGLGYLASVVFSEGLLTSRDGSQPNEGEIL
jgi:O-antigen/teichoic acid export membrane protein